MDNRELDKWLGCLNEYSSTLTESIQRRNMDAVHKDVTAAVSAIHWNELSSKKFPQNGFTAFVYVAALHDRCLRDFGESAGEEVWICLEDLRYVVELMALLFKCIGE